MASIAAVLRLHVQVFDALPLAAVLNNKVFLCHGGISPYLHRPQDVNAIRRPLVSGWAAVEAGHAARARSFSFEQCTLGGACCSDVLHSAVTPSPLLLPPPCAQDVNPNGEGLLADLLWADPSGHISGWCANPRGVSFVFGLDVAQQWLRQQVSYEDTTPLATLCMQCLLP